MVEAAVNHQGPLGGLLVVDLSTTLPGAQATQFLADCGATVVMAEPPGGSPLRDLPGWPGLLRGKQSVVTDLRSAEDLERFHALLRKADVLVTTMRPRAAEARGLTADQLAAKYPRLVAAHITGWGSTGPWRDYKGWEALVMAKAGVMHAKRGIVVPPRPSFISVPYASWGAAHAAVQSILAALIERDKSGTGQVVESNLVTGMGAMDPYNWFYEMILERYPDAFTPMDAMFDDNGHPQAMLLYALLTASTSDGAWLQFAQTSPRLMQAWLTELGLIGELADPKWQGFPALPTAELRTEWWDMMLERVRARTVAEWEQAFEANHDLSAEVFRTAEESLDHPQTQFEGRVVTVADPRLDAVRQPSTLIHSAKAPLVVLRPAPEVGEHDPALFTAPKEAAGQPNPVSHRTLPLAGATVLEFGSMFAGPYGATLLTDLGARVIKVEPLDGDNIRNLLAFPEAGGAKVLQGKESVAIDFATPEGLELVHGLVKLADIALLCFRGAAAERAKIDEATLKQINPNLVVLNTSGYGNDGPFAHRAAYAPSIGAAGGLAATDAPGWAVPPTDLDDTHRRAATLINACATASVQADGVAAVAVGSALLVGLYAQRRGIEMPEMSTTMLASAQHALINYNTTYATRPPASTVDASFLGLSALYRMYRAADGWVFLAAPTAQEWPALAKALSGYVDLENDAQFATAEARATHDAELVEALASVFHTKTKAEWERELSDSDVGCVEVAETNPERLLQSDAYFEAGYSVEAYSPIFEQHRRLAPLWRFSRSLTKADGGCTIGQHTKAVLREIGVADERVADLMSRRIIGCTDGN
jgi:crotonobetainyl-CoA:carnitine CoA-transferase CaiB-like acyl-CoA transferase